VIPLRRRAVRREEFQVFEDRYDALVIAALKSQAFEVGDGELGGSCSIHDLLHDWVKILGGRHVTRTQRRPVSFGWATKTRSAQAFLDLQCSLEYAMSRANCDRRCIIIWPEWPAWTAIVISLGYSCVQSSCVGSNDAYFKLLWFEMRPVWGAILSPSFQRTPT